MATWINRRFVWVCCAKQGRMSAERIEFLRDLAGAKKPKNDRSDGKGGEWESLIHEVANDLRFISNQFQLILTEDLKNLVPSHAMPVKTLTF